MTTVKTLLETLDKTRMSGFYDVESLGEEFGIPYGCYNLTVEEYFKECEHEKVCWICTDTLVGIFFLFFKEEFVGVRIQVARKDDSYFYWKDSDTFEKVKSWFTELYLKSLKINPSFINFDLDLSGYAAQAEYAKNNKW